MLDRLNHNRGVTLTLLFLCAVLGIYVAHHLFTGVRADVTQEGLYSLTDGSKQILERMQEEGVAPVDVQLYFSLTAGKTLPSFIKDFITYEDYIRNLLREYQKASGGKVRVEFIDPMPDTDEAQDALDAGLDGKVINQNGDQFFFGMVFETGSGSRRVLDFLWPEEQETIEYKISKEIYNLVWPGTQRIAVLSSLQVLGTGDNPYMAQLLQAQGKQPARKWIALELLDEQYQLEELDPGVTEIASSDTDLLLVIHPKGLSQETLAAVDSWVHHGGNALVFLDPYATQDQPPLNPQDPQARLQALQYQPASDFGSLLSAWGLAWQRDAFAADLEMAGRSGGRLGPPESMILDLQLERQLHEGALADNVPALQGIESLHLVLAGVLEETEGAPEGLTRTPLITTTDVGDALTIQPGFGGGPGGASLAYVDLGEPSRLRDVYSPTGPQALAYQLQGRFPRVFPDAATPPTEAEADEADETDEAETEEATESAEPAEAGDATVIVVADTDLLADTFAFGQSMLGTLTIQNDNSTLFLNLVDYLLGSQELMQVRARKGIERPFTLFDQIEGAAEQASLEREQELRSEIEVFQQELNEKQRAFTQSNAALLEKRLQDEVNQLNERVREANRELIEIRKQRRAALSNEETNVRFTVMWAMPLLVLFVGVLTAARRRAALNVRRRG